MCVDTQHYKCCCGCMTLTQATILIGIIYILSAILDAIVGQWINFVFCLVVGLLFGMVIFKPYNEGVRKLLYYLYLILQIIGAVGFIIAVIVIFASDWEQDWCTAYYYDYNQYYYNHCFYDRDY